MSPIGINPPEQKDLLELEGVIERVIYSNEENGYTVCELSLSDEEYITAVGVMPYAVVGESVKALGQWTVHPSFGRQFKVEYFEKQLPATTSTILKYLSAKTVKGIGPKTAARVALELKDKIAKNFPQFSTAPDDMSEFVPAEPAASANNLSDARDALAVLGYSRSEIAAALKDVNPASPVEDIIKTALGQLMKF